MTLVEHQRIFTETISTER